MKNPIKIRYINLPLQYNQIKKELIKNIEHVFKSGQFIMGPEVKKLETRFAKYCDCKYALGVANGTDAIFLALKALDIGANDEVITVPNSFIATAGAIGNTGAKPIFVDIREDYNINPDQIEEKITEKTKAILPVHLTGRPADMNPVLEIAEKYDLYVIEDAAQAIGATYYGHKVGSFGIAGCFSMHPLKNLNAGGDAGMITTNNSDYYDTLVKLHNHGLRNRDECDFWGFNSRLDSIQAAIINTKFNYLDEWNNKIRSLVDLYQENLRGIVEFPEDKDFEKSVYHLFMIQCDDRDELQKYLLNNGIETKIHYPIPIHLQTPAKKLGYIKGDLPVIEKQSERILSLPIYPELASDDIEFVSQKIKEFYEVKK